MHDSDKSHSSFNRLRLAARTWPGSIGARGATNARWPSTSSRAVSSARHTWRSALHSGIGSFTRPSCDGSNGSGIRACLPALRSVVRGAKAIGLQSLGSDCRRLRQVAVRSMLPRTGDEIRVKVPRIDHNSTCARIRHQNGDLVVVGLRLRLVRPPHRPPIPTQHHEFRGCRRRLLTSRTSGSALFVKPILKRQASVTRRSALPAVRERSARRATSSGIVTQRSVLPCLRLRRPRPRRRAVRSLCAGEVRGHPGRPAVGQCPSCRASGGRVPGRPACDAAGAR